MNNFASFSEEEGGKGGWFIEVWDSDFMLLGAWERT